MYFIHKYSVSQQYGGPEEGGWWYDHYVLQKDFVPQAFKSEERAFAVCRKFNEKEHQRRKEENTRDYTSVLSYEDEFFSYDVKDTAYPPDYEPERTPHYE